MIFGSTGSPKLTMGTVCWRSQESHCCSGLSLVAVSRISLLQRLSHCSVFSCWGEQALGTSTPQAQLWPTGFRVQTQHLWHMGLVVLRRVQSFSDKGLNSCPLHCEWILDLCDTWKSSCLLLFHKMAASLVWHCMQISGVFWRPNQWVQMAGGYSSAAHSTYIGSTLFVSVSI